MDYKKDLDRAFRLADVSDGINMKYYRSTNLKITTKPDNTPVTQADEETERQLSKIVLEEYKESYLGEEGVNQKLGEKLWIVDPVDGTKNFLRNVPIWSSLIAVTKNGDPVASVVTAPALGRRWWASLGGGSWTKDVDGTVRQLRVSQIDKLEDSFLLTPSLFTKDEVQADLPEETLLNLFHTVWRQRGLGDFFGHMLVAEGAADISLDFPKSWDIAAPMLIVQEAGGSVWMKSDIMDNPTEEQIAVVSNKKIEASVLAALNLT